MNSKPTLAAIRQSLTDCSRTVALHALAIKAMGTELPSDASGLMVPDDMKDILELLQETEKKLDDVRLHLYVLQQG